MKIDPVAQTRVNAPASQRVPPVKPVQRHEQQEAAETAKRELENAQQQQTASVQRPEEIKQALEDMNKAVFALNERLQFKIHDETNRIMVKVVDKKTDEVIKEIPPEKFLDMVAKLQEMVGVLVDTKA